MATLSQLARALGRTLQSQALDVASSLWATPVKEGIRQRVAPRNPASRFLAANLLSRRSPDGAILEGLVPENAYAKYALPKGLPTAGKRTLAIENDPHVINDFDGVIKSGYGKGTKKLLWTGTGIVKIKGQTFPAKVNYHLHDADRAGLHYDIVAEGVPPGTQQWELHIPNGDIKGRYAFVTTGERRMIVVPMKDAGVLLPKPDYTLRDSSFLESLDRDKYVIEHKKDGSLGNVLIKDNRAVFRSHRESGETYYDRLPGLEHVGNTSKFAGFRLIVSGPNQDGTQLRGELYHPDGPGRVGGILNSLPANAQKIQQVRGNVTFYVWDIVKLRGKDVSKMPYEQRRELFIEAVKDIRQFNGNWHYIDAARKNETALQYYNRVIKLPLPDGEGVVIKKADDPSGNVWYKVKQTSDADVEVIDILPGLGKYAGSVGRLVVRNPETGAVGEVGSLSITDEQRQWIWDNRGKLLSGPNMPIARIRCQEITNRGVPRAGVFLGFHEGKGSEVGLRMYAEGIAGGDPKETERVKYALISAAGWRR